MSKIEYPQIKAEDYLESTFKEINGVKYNASNLEEIKELKEFIESLEKKYSFQVDSNAVSVLSFGTMPPGAGAGFAPVVKILKTNNINPNSYRSNLAFIHEYCHALDFQYDLYKEFIDFYKKDVESSGRSVVEDENDFSKFGCGMTLEEIMQFLYSNDLKNYKISNIREYVACSMHGYMFSELLEEELRKKTEEIVKRFFKI